jgi:2-amino-4-hydroxy-6-hydroxymethyldihydropteridine diphosphokinase
VSVGVTLGLGSNMGDAVANLREAMRHLFAGPELGFVRASSVYRTPPWGMTEQNDFANAVVLGTTGLEPLALLGFVKGIERAMGRAPAERWGPRLIDIDLIDMDGVVMATPVLTLPHARMFERGFVLVPLAEIDPGRMVAGRSVAEALRSMETGPIIAPPLAP